MRSETGNMFIVDWENIEPLTTNTKKTSLII